MENKNKFTFDKWYFRVFAGLIGIIMFVVIFVVSTQTDIANEQGHLSDTANYIKKQCATYSSLNLASEAKSLMRLSQGAQQIRRDIYNDSEEAKEAGEQKKVLTKNQLKRYASEQYLTGIIILDASGKVETQYYTDKAGADGLKEDINKKVVSDVMKYPKKTYSVRLDCEDGSYIDLAAVGRKDKTGVVITYYHTPVEYVGSYGLSFQNLLSDYSLTRNGTIAVTKGNKIVASNDESIIGLQVEDISVLNNIRKKAVNNKLIHVRTSDSRERSFGLMDRGRDYYVYAYIPERTVFDTTPKNLLFTMIVYVCVLFFIQMMRWRISEQYRKEQLSIDEAYQEQLKEAAHKAESANIAKTEFLQRMSHDIRTPINGIRGMVEIGEHYQYDLNKQAECRKKIREASALLLELVNEVLDMGKLESGEVVLESKSFDVVDVTMEVTEVLEKQAAERGIQIICEPPSVDHRKLIGSPLHVKRLLMNIMSNAVKYNKENGKIVLNCYEVRCEEEIVWIEFVCADTGIGMSPEFQEHLFEPFTQEGNDARSTYAGTGLGMAITKSLVDKMEGAINFESEQGVGTTYYIIIPFKLDKNGMQQQEHGDEEEVSLEGMRVLLAEDNDLNMEIAEFLLENEGVIITKASNGQEAVDIFKESEVNTFDAILMDVMMPIMDGHQATRTIRALPREDAKTIPILAMTANAFAEDAKKAEEAGMNEHLTKPLEATVVIRTLGKYRKR